MQEALRARGNVSVDFNWNDSHVEQVTITGLPLRAGERGGGSGESGESGAVTAGGRSSVVLKVPAGSIARDLYGNEFPTDSSGFVHLSVRSGESVTLRFRR